MSRSQFLSATFGWLVCAVALGVAEASFAAPPQGAPAAPAPAAVPADHAEKMARGLALFQEHVRPLLVSQCLECHGGKQTKGDFDLGTREKLLDSGMIELGKADESRLYQLTAQLEEPHMPFKRPRLSEADLGHLAAWINLGAPYDRPLVDKAAGAAGHGAAISAEQRAFWSFRPLAKVDVPAPQSAPWCRTPVDRFIQAKLAERGIRANAVADRRTLIRRVYFDLTGLPPLPEEIEAFVADKSPTAYEDLVDRVLASPHYGERWGRHWLDVARFAETGGFQNDTPLPDAWRYRDFVINAFNADMPFDKFVSWQIAGDELAPGDPLALAATGFLAVGVYQSPVTVNELETARYGELDDFVSTIGTSMLGLTIGCARCHDHKYDPIPTRDYYRLVATFATTIRGNVDLPPVAASRVAERAAWEKERQARAEAVKAYELKARLSFRFAAWTEDRKALDATNQEIQEKLAKGGRVAPALIEGLSLLRSGKPEEQLSNPQREALYLRFARADKGWKSRYDSLQEHLKTRPASLPAVLVATEGVRPLPREIQGVGFAPETYILKRGDPRQKEEVATQSFLQVLMRTPDAERHWQVERPQDAKTSLRRTALARWLTDPECGAGNLLARVIANRVWYHHFGRGIVNTPSDFGMQGSRPTHPELLDWLAAELIKNGWHLKPLHRLLMTSAAYMQSAQWDATRSERDVENSLYWRWGPRRLEAEAIRDAMLVVWGRLDPTMFGPGTLEERSARRSVYYTVSRSEPVALLNLFDWPDALNSIGSRDTSTVAPQALALMNSDTVLEFAAGLADALEPAAQKSLGEAVDLGYRKTLGRPPRASERASSLAYLEAQDQAFRQSGASDARHQALKSFCQVLLSLNEFVYLY